MLPVPPGTIVRDLETGEVLGEVLEDGDQILVAKGGRGGKGNAFFATPTHQSPREWQPGEDGIARTLELELKLIADVGLVGQPNAGKSTLLSVISAARPKIADYPFTTLRPNLGVVQLSDHRTFVVADIPGIIEGAHEGKGLGLQFLRHIERTRILAFLIPIDAMDWQEEYDGLRAEIGATRRSSRRSRTASCSRRWICSASSRRRRIDAPDAFGVYAISAAGRTGDSRKCWTRSGASCSTSGRRRRCRRPTPFSPSERSRHAALALSLLPGVGAVRFRDIDRAIWLRVAGVGCHAAVTAKRTQRVRAPQRVLEDAERVGARVVAFGDADYPERLSRARRSAASALRPRRARAAPRAVRRDRRDATRDELR